MCTTDYFFFFLIIQKTVSSSSKSVKNLLSPWLSIQIGDLLFFSEGDENRIVVAKFHRKALFSYSVSLCA